jgi:arsenate reductase-like glutaredoxin family protein
MSVERAFRIMTEMVGLLDDCKELIMKEVDHLQGLINTRDEEIRELEREKKDLKDELMIEEQRWRDEHERT